MGRMGGRMLRDHGDTRAEALAGRRASVTLDFFSGADADG